LSSQSPAPPDVRASKALALDLIHAALGAIEPGAAVRRHVRREADLLFVGQKTFDLAEIENVYVVGAGKAGGPMALAIEEILGDRLTEGVVNLKYGSTAPTRKIKLVQAGHPLEADGHHGPGARRIGRAPDGGVPPVEHVQGGKDLGARVLVEVVPLGIARGGRRRGRRAGSGGEDEQSGEDREVSHDWALWIGPLGSLQFTARPDEIGSPGVCDA